MFRLFSEPRTEEIPYSTFKAPPCREKSEGPRHHARYHQGQQACRQGRRQARREKPFTVVRIEDPDLVKNLDASGISYRGEISGQLAQGFPAHLDPSPRRADAHLELCVSRMGAGGPGETFMSFGKSRAKIYGESDVKVTFNDVAGVDEAKEELMEIIEFLRHPGEVHQARRPHPQGRAARRPAGHGQDAPGQGRGRRGQGAVLFHERLRVRRDVRGRGRVARARPVPAGRAEGALHHLHRRARRARPRARRRASRAPTRSGNRP